MSIWNLLLIVCAAGGAGGIVNALLTDNGFILPRTETATQVKIIRPGVIGNIIIGAVAAGISWGLYGPFNLAVVFGATPPSADPLPQPYLTLAALVGAVLVGIAGAKWLTNEVDKKLLRAAAGEAAARPSKPDAAREIMLAMPADALSIAKRAG
jgi:hypothetical protein